MTTIPRKIGQAQEAIGHHCDGPITPYVLISRAIELEGHDKDIVADALYNLLEAYGFLNDTTDNDQGV